MRVACSRCETGYDVPDAKLERGAVKIRCTQCGNMFAVRKRATGTSTPDDAAPAAEATPGREASFDDFDFQSFQEPEAASTETQAELDLAAQAQVPDEPAPPDEDIGDFDEDELSSLGELDLGDFEDLDTDLGVDDEEELDLGPSTPAEEPLERVSEDDLLPSEPTGPAVQGVAEDVPRLDIQRGPRRQESPLPSAMVARDRRRSPLLWLVALAAVATLGYTGYNLYRHPEAFTFLNPTRLRALWSKHSAEAKLAVEGLRGYYADLSRERRMFVIRGEVVNRSTEAQSLIRVRGNLFGPGGQTLAEQEVFCGNLLSESELDTLPAATIRQRLQNEVGDGLRNVDIAAGKRVPFMVVFTDPPPEVEKFSVDVTGAQSAAGS